jgi:hypothetical protein
MIHASILTTRHTTFGIDVLEGDEPDALGAARIVPGNLRGTVKAIIVGNDEMERSLGRTLGPMASGDTLTSADPRFKAEVLRVAGVKPETAAQSV